MEKDKHHIRISDLLKAHPDGLTIADIMKKTKLARHTVLARLHNLVGQDKVNVRKINMAKVHYWKADTKEDHKEEAKHPAHKDTKVTSLQEEHLRKDLKEEKKAKEKLKEAKLKEILAEEKVKEAKIEEKIAETEEQEKEQEVAFDMADIKAQIQSELQSGKIKPEEAKLKQQRDPITHFVDKDKHPGKKADEFIKTGIPGFDELFDQGIPKGSELLVAGGAGSGKTIMTMQILKNHAEHGEKCLYMSFEESEEHLIHHMEDFGWNPQEQIKKGNLLIKRFNPFDITRSVDALLMKAKGELLIDVEPIIFPKGFEPDFIVVDSLTAISSAFTDKDDSYRIYIEQLFRFFEKIKATSFLITETEQIPKIFSRSGVEEFLADGVIVLYNIKRGNVRENAIEVLKLRGAKHQKKIVAMQITDDGVVVYPDQEVFGGVE